MKKKLCEVYKKANKQNLTSGFTLIELLIAAFITTILVSVTGVGLVAMTTSSKKTNAETQRRVELNRALDFIADEVRQAKPIAKNASANLSTLAPNFNSTSRIPVLTLQIPGVSQAVVYYIASAASPWLGPNAVYRWGPTFKDDGQYVNPTDLTTWTYEPLADLIVDTAPSTSPSCQANWSLNPPINSITGFYACVDPTGRIADIHLRGKLTNAYGNSIQPLEVSTQTFARSSTQSFSTGFGGSIQSGGNTGTITLTGPATAYFQILGGAISCGGGPTATSLPTTTTINVTPPGGSTTSTTAPSSAKGLNFSGTAGTTFTVTGAISVTTGSCAGFTASYNSATDNGTQVLTLKNGDTPPLFSPFGNQKSINNLLNNYLNPSTGKVTIADNQVLFLYDLGLKTPIIPAYYMQDLIVLATISPNSN